MSAEGGLAPIAEVRCDSLKLITQRTSRQAAGNTIGSIARQVLAGLSQKQKEFRFEEISAIIERVAGPKAGGHFKIVRLTKNKMSVNVESSVWLYEFRLKKSELKRELERAKINLDMVFRLGDI